MEMKLTPAPQNSVPTPQVLREPPAPPLRVPDLILPVPDDRVLIQRIAQVEYTDRSRWTGTYWIFLVKCIGQAPTWVRATAEEGTYEEIEDQPDDTQEEPNQAAGGLTGPVPG